MILVLCGTQKQDFTRMLVESEKLYDLDDEIYVQAGHTIYRSPKLKTFTFLRNQELQKLYEKADVIITHAGAGSIIQGLRNNKKIICVPRLSKLGEHVNDHQVELPSKLADLHKVKVLKESDDIRSLYLELKDMSESSWDLTGNVNDIIIDYINSNEVKDHKIDKVFKFIFDPSFLKFAIVGVLNTLVDGLFYFTMVTAGTYYMTAKIISFVISVIFSFFVNSKWTYKTKITLRKFITFPISTLPNFLAQMIFMYLVVEVLGWSDKLAWLIAIVIATPIAFIFAKFILQDKHS